MTLIWPVLCNDDHYERCASLFLASALECYTCKDKEDDSACGKMGEEWDGDHDSIELVKCPEPGKNETGRAVCGKTITTFQSNQNPDSMYSCSL